jgi:hypothetical protein
MYDMSHKHLCPFASPDVSSLLSAAGTCTERPCAPQAVAVFDCDTHSGCCTRGVELRRYDPSQASWRRRPSVWSGRWAMAAGVGATQLGRWWCGSGSDRASSPAVVLAFTDLRSRLGTYLAVRRPLFPVSFVHFQSRFLPFLFKYLDTIYLQPQHTSYINQHDTVNTDPTPHPFLT